MSGSRKIAVTAVRKFRDGLQKNLETWNGLVLGDPKYCPSDINERIRATELLLNEAEAALEWVKQAK